MDATQLVEHSLARIQAGFNRILDGLTEEQLSYRPSTSANSIAWLLWHLTRVQDNHISDLLGEDQVWVSQNWCGSFNLPPDTTNTGYGHGPDEVAGIKGDAQAILGYYGAVFESSKKLLNKLSPEDLDIELAEPQYNPLPTIGVRLVSIISDNTQHVGQAAYLRGLILSQDEN